MGKFGICGALRSIALGVVAALSAVVGPGDEAQAQDANEPLTIAVMTSTEPGSGRRTAEAIEAYTRWQADRINDAGGVRGRQLDMVYFDDANDIEKTAANVDAALKLDNLLGIVGVWSSTRGAAVTERIGESGVPFISEISRQELIEDHPNIFSMARAASADLPAFIDFVTRPKKRVVYFGVDGDLFTLQFKETLERLEAEERVDVVSWEWTPLGQKLDPAAVDAAIGRIKAEEPDLLILAVGSSRGGALMKQLSEAGITTPVYGASGSVVRMLNGAGDAGYGADLFQTRSSVPGVTNSRLEELLQTRDYADVGDGFGPSDRSYGASYADVVAVLAEAAQGPKGASLEEIRKGAISGLARTSRGGGIFRGATRDWTFDEGGSATEPVYLLRLPKGTREFQLYERQVGGLDDSGAPTRMPIAHVSMDLEQVSGIDTVAETFDASFYLSIESRDGLDIGDFEFANAAQSELGAGTKLQVRELENGLGGGRGGLRVYKVDGRFQFSPDLSRYPFDRQSLSIQLQPADTTTPFVLQPPPERLRDHDFSIPGWAPTGGVAGAFVGGDNALITVVTGGGTTPRILAFQRYSYTWVVERQALDYSLRVVLPLTLILLVAYVSVFIPKDRFDSALSLQVTALLSAIALYFTIPKISPDSATLSDQVFVFAETVIVWVTLLSILRVNCARLAGGWIAWGIGVVQIVSVPLMSFIMIRYVSAVKSGEGETIAGKSFGEAMEVLAGLLAP